MDDDCVGERWKRRLLARGSVVFVRWRGPLCPGVRDRGYGVDSNMSGMDHRVCWSGRSYAVVGEDVPSQADARDLLGRRTLPA